MNKIEPIIEEMKEEKQKELFKKYKVRTLSDILKNGVPEIKWRIDRILPERGILIIGGASGSLKSWFAMNLTLACATGNNLFNKYETKQCNVLYIDEENGDITLPNRFDKLINAMGCDNDIFDSVFLSIFNGIKLDETIGLELLRELIEINQPRVIILDSMVRCMTGEEDKAKDVKKIFDNLKPIINKYQDISFVILHHTVKSRGRGINALRGSGDFSAFADVVIMFNNSFSYTNVETVKNRHVDRGDFAKFALKLESTINDGLTLKHMECNQDEKTVIHDCELSILDWVDEGNFTKFQSKEVIKAMEEQGYRKNTVYSALSELLNKKDISKQRRGQWAVENPKLTVDIEDIPDE